MQFEVGYCLKSEIFYSFFSTPQLVEFLLIAEKEEVLEWTKYFSYQH